MPKNCKRRLASSIAIVTIRGMYATDTILTYSFPLGNLGGTRLRVSYFFPVLTLGIFWRTQSLQLALLATAVVFCSVLLHELVHLLVARSTSGDMEKLQMWPLGGLSEPFGRGYLQDHVHTMLAAPVANLLIALSCLLVLDADQIIPLMNPFTVFPVDPSETLITTVWRLTFFSNLILFFVNMIPITPFDSGVLLRTYLTTRFTESESRDLMIRLGIVAAIFGMLVGFVFDISVLVLVAGFILVLQIHDNMRWYEVQHQSQELTAYDQIDDQVFNDDWFDSEESEYSEESSEELLDRWREEREQERVRREQEERREEEDQMDRILQKLHDGGRESLTSNELHLLKRVSDRYRDRRQHS